MFSRLKRAAWTFTAVTAAFLVYSLVAVPWIEPPGRQRSLLAMLLGAAGNPPQRLHAAQLESLFSDGDWELDNPMVLETDRGMLLIRDYRVLDDGSLELKPCTLILYASPDEDPASRNQGCLVLRSAGGAVLRFDQPLRLARGEFGRLVGGWLVGPVTIRSPESRPGANDQLDVQTGSIQITPERITAPQDIEFRYGSNRGRGRDLIITLDPPEPSAAAHDMRVGELRSLELVHLEHLHLHLEDLDGFIDGGGLQRPHDQPPAPTQLEVTCQGPFRFDFRQRVATFEDRVAVLRRNPQGPVDRLTGDLLSLHLGMDETAASPAAPGNPLSPSAMQLERIAIQGNPVVLEMPSEAMTARAARVEYDARSGQVRIEDGRQARLRYQQNEFEAASLEYTPAEDAGLGQLLARGPGRMHGSLPDDPDKTFEATWQDRLILQPHLGDHAISLIGDARVRYEAMGEFAAENLHLWLQQIPEPEAAEPAEKARPAYRPVRMLAERQVHVDTVQLTAAIQKVELWIRYTEAEPSVDPPAAPTEDPARPLEIDPESEPARSRFDIVGQHLQVQVLRDGSEAVVEHLILEGDIRLREVQTADPEDIPLNITADLVQVEQANTPQTRIRLLGRPAEIAGRGVAVRGNNLQLNREHNHLWMLGPGRMTLPLAAEQLARGAPPNASPLPATGDGQMTVAWNQQMVFDGRIARFGGDVQLHGRQQADSGEVFNVLVTSPELEVALEQRIDFAGTQPPAEIDAAELRFHGPVFLQNTGFRAGEPTSIDRMQVRDLTVHRRSGRLHALGPGWGTSIRMGEPLAGTPLGGTAGSRDPDSAKLSYLRVDFEDEIAGNFHHREVEFRGLVRTLFGPVEHWRQELDPDPAGGLDEGVFVLSSHRLAVAETPSTARDSAAIEVVADGNATVEGKAFTARGWRISYARAKQLLILEGDGRNDAELWMKGSVTPDAAAQQIRFWTHNNSIQVDGGRFFNLSQLGTLSR